MTLLFPLDIYTPGDYIVPFAFDIFDNIERAKLEDGICGRGEKELNLYFKV